MGRDKLRKAPAQRAAKGRLLMHLPDGPAAHVDVVRRLADIARPHPAQKILLPVKPLAMRKDRAKPVPGPLGQFGEEALAVAVDVAEEGKLRRIGAGFDAMGGDVAPGIDLDDEEPCHMQPVEAAEGHQRIVGIGQPGLQRH